MRFEERLKQVESLAEEALRQGKTMIRYEEVIARLKVSPNYARDLLRVFANQKGYVYNRGTLYLILPPDENGEDVVA